MAITIHNRHRILGREWWTTEWAGLSTDDKTTIEDVKVNDLFFEEDTGDFYYVESQGSSDTPAVWKKVGSGASSQVLWEGTINAIYPDEGGGGGYWSTDIDDMILPDNIVVDYDGVEYECSVYYDRELDDTKLYGAPWDIGSDRYDFNDYPFRINNNPYEERIFFLSSTEGEHTVKITEQ